MKRKFFVVGTFFGIQLRVHYSWFLIFGLVAWAVITSYIPIYRDNLSTVASLSAGLIITIIFFASVIAHEYAHSIVANHRGLHIKRITLFVFGGASELQHEPDTAKTEFLMTSAGPLTSLVLSGIFALLWVAGQRAHLTALEIVCGPLALLNFVVGIFNLLPAYPLDGGRILRSLLWMARKDFLSATRSATTAGVLFSYSLMAIGILEIFTGYLMGGIWFVLIGLFMLQSARLSFMQTFYETVLGRRKVSDMMTADTPTVPADTRLRQLMSEYALAHGQYDFLVTDSTEQPIGMLQIAAMGDIPLEELNVTVDHLMLPLRPTYILGPNDSSAKAYRIMQLNGLNLLPVMTAQKLLGVVQRRYLDEYVRLQPIKRPLTLPQ